MKVFLVTLLFLIGAFSSLSSQTNNLLVNGDFNGDPSCFGWEKITGDELSQTTGGKSGGYLWLNDDRDTVQPAIRQAISGFRAGQKYIISGVYRPGAQATNHCNCPGTPVLAIDIDGRELATFPMPVVDSIWLPFTTVFMATQSTHVLQLRGQINNTQGDVAIDNISIQPELVDWFRLKSMYEDRGKEEKEK